MLPHQLIIIQLMLLTEVSQYIQCNKIYNLKKKKINFDSVFSNSKNITKSSIYIVNNKKTLNIRYLDEAVKNGAIAIISSKYITNINLTQYIVSNINLSLSILLKKLNPIKPKNSISITGTNGKTSVLWYISQICLHNKIPTKSYGTLGYYINCKKKNNSNLTTPEFEVLHQKAFLKRKNISNFIFESSSHGLEQNRLNDFPVDIAAITNITQDHLDYHKNIKNYKKAKFKLFTKYLVNDGYAILNEKINGINNLKKKLLKTKKVVTYGLKNSDINIVDYNKKIKVKIFKKNYYIYSKKLSSIELENIACAIACCISLKIKANKILKNLKNITNPPGRLESINNDFNKINFKIFVDYAHTPDALKQVLISQTNNNKKPNVVFGCGGNRDKNKRSIMGLIASKYADKVYITDDNPRNENPYKIRKEILVNCKKGIEISDRKKAISKAIHDLKKNDVLIIAGKGHEKNQVSKNSIKLFDDISVAKNELKKLLK